MGVVSRPLAIAVLAAASACNVISGADGLSTDPSTEESSMIPPRAHETITDASSSSSGSVPPGDGGGHGEAGPAADGASPLDAGTDAPPATGMVFFDDFARADSPTIGNDWTEKTDVFSLVGGAVRQTGTGSYRDLLVHRPSSEDALDVMLDVDVTHDKINGDPCLYARMQPASATIGQLVSYTFYSYTDEAYIDRDDGTVVTGIASQAISPALPLGATYHMTFRVTGTGPVKLEGTVKDANGKVVLSIATQDGSAKAITAAGGVGFGSGGADGALFDNFRRETF